jgi:AraC-like DNA-binding protein
MKKIPVRSLTATQKEPVFSESCSIRDLNTLLAGQDMQQELHRHNFFYILAVQKGSGSHEIDFTSYEVANHSIFFLRPGQVHTLLLKAGSTGFLIQFEEEFYYPPDKTSMQRLKKASTRNFYKLDAHAFEKPASIMAHMLREYTERLDGYLDVIKAGLDILVIGLQRETATSDNLADNTSQYTQERYDEFLELLDYNITNHKQVAFYTGLMNLSSYQLNEITKSSVGKTASEIINEHIVLEAKRYLLATPNQVKEIADHLGYEDISYFIRFFRKHAGFSPEAFRHNFR